MKILSFLISVALLVIIAVPRVTQAAILDSVTLTTTAIGTRCSDYTLQIDYEFTGVVVDWSNAGTDFDLIGYTVVDANGVAVSAKWQGWTIGSSFIDTSGFGPGNIINDFIARPLTITFYDLTTTPPSGQNTQAIFDAIVSQNAPVLHVMVHDPADTSTFCASLPLVAPPALPLGLDGRINPDEAAPFVAYVVAGDLQLYYPQGGLRLTVTAADIASVKCPEAGAALIKEGNGVSVYRLADCSFQVMSASLGGEKTYTLIFESLTSRNYQSFEQ